MIRRPPRSTPFPYPTLFRSTRRFDADASAALGVVASATTELQAAATSMSSTAEETSRQSTAVAAASEQASTNVATVATATRSEEHTSELQSPCNLVCRLLLE